MKSRTLASIIAMTLFAAVAPPLQLAAQERTYTILHSFSEAPNNNYFPNLSDSNYRKKPASLNDINLTVGTNAYTNSTDAVQGINDGNLSAISSSSSLEITQDISTAATIAQDAAVNIYFTEITAHGAKMEILVDSFSSLCSRAHLVNETLLNIFERY